MNCNGNGIKMLTIIPSSSQAMFLVSRIAGVTDLTKQEIRAVTKNHHVYEVHLKKKYSKQGKVTYSPE
jgi:thymidylate synthase